MSGLARRSGVRRTVRRDRVVAGWSRTRFRVDPGARVLDVGSGAFPNRRADVSCDLEPDGGRHRNGRPAVIDRPFVVADVQALPFRTGAFDFVVASHIAEHVPDPGRLCAELARVAQAGYIETPSPLGDVLLHEDYHLWRVHRRGGRLVFRAKGPRPRMAAALADGFYRVYNAGRPGGGRPVAALPPGRAGRVLGLALLAVRGTLNRTGVLHTRVRFAPARPLCWDAPASGHPGPATLR